MPLLDPSDFAGGKAVAWTDKSPRRILSDLCAANDIDEIRRRDEMMPYSADLLHHGLQTAASCGHADLCIYLLGHGAQLSRAVASAGVRSESRDVLLVLLDHGWDINDEDGLLWPHVLITVVHNEDLVRWCLNHGASVRTAPQPANGSAGPLLDSAAARGSVSTFRTLIGRGAPLGHPLHTAAYTYRDDPERAHMLEYLVHEVGIDVNEVVDVGYDPRYVEGGPLLGFLSPHHVGTPLHYTIKFPSLEGLMWLLDKGANPAVENHQGVNAVEYARMMPGMEGAIPLLEEKMRLFEGR